MKVFTYITLRVGSSEKTVSSFLVDTVNSELKSSSIITAFRSVAHFIYSFLFEALAVMPLGKLLKGVICSTDALVLASCDVRIPSLPNLSKSHSAPLALQSEFFHKMGFQVHIFYSVLKTVQ